MSLGRLLAAGKSLVGGQERTGRYRVKKGVALPKFISPRNPFASAASPETNSSPADASDKERRATPPVATAKLDAEITQKSVLQFSIRSRAVRWLGEWGRKFNPLPRLPRQPGPARLAISRNTNPPIQTELSLDQVKVVRNDLSDADLEVVPVKATRSSASSRSREKFALAGSTWDRLTMKIFGARPT